MIEHVPARMWTMKTSIGKWYSIIYVNVHIRTCIYVDRLDVGKHVPYLAVWMIVALRSILRMPDAVLALELY